MMLPSQIPENQDIIPEEIPGGIEGQYYDDNDEQIYGQQQPAPNVTRKVLEQVAQEEVNDAVEYVTNPEYLYFTEIEPHNVDNSIKQLYSSLVVQYTTPIITLLKKAYRDCFAVYKKAVEFADYNPNQQGQQIQSVASVVRNIFAGKITTTDLRTFLNNFKQSLQIANQFVRITQVEERNMYPITLMENKLQDIKMLVYHLDDFLKDITSQLGNKYNANLDFYDFNEMYRPAWN